MAKARNIGKNLARCSIKLNIEEHEKSNTLFQKMKICNKRKTNKKIRPAFLRRKSLPCATQKFFHRTPNCPPEAGELSEREKYQHEEFRDQLLDQLTRVDTSNLNRFEKDRLRIIIYESNLYDSTNRREMLGKHFTEIQNDANYYRIISEKAKSILGAIGKG